MSDSIFARYFREIAFVDRFADGPQDDGVTVIVPIIHSNELWRANLYSFYREIPIARLLIGDGGCIDESITVAREFPRVEVLDHTSFKTLGFSIRHLIEAVQTEWFIYLQSDVFLPEGWFDEMASHRTDFEWFGCSERDTVLVEYDGTYGPRPWAGSQFGRRDAFIERLDTIDDDFVYRQEDYVFSELVRSQGFREGRIDRTFHYHQTLVKKSPWGRVVTGVQISTEVSPEENVRQWALHGKGIVKYLPATSWPLAVEAARSNRELKRLGARDEVMTSRWIKETNPAWLWRVRAASVALGLEASYWRVVSWPPKAARSLARRFVR